MTTLLYHISKKSAILFVFFLLFYEFSTYIANDMIMPGMIAVVRSFHASENMVPASLTVYILGGASLQLFLGPLSDRYGRRPIMIYGASFFLLCSIVIAVSQSIEQFILARFFQGMGLCFISVVGYATLHEVFQEIHAIRIISIMNNITIMAPLAGPLLGAIIIHYYGWREIFIIISFLAATALIGLWFFMPEVVGKMRLDGTENKSTLLHYNIILNNYLALIKNKKFMLGSIASGLSVAPLLAWIGISPLILIKHAQLSVITYGLLQIPIFMSVTIGNFIMRYLTYRLNLIRLSLVGASLTTVGTCLCTLLIPFFHQHYIALIIALSIYAIGLGIIGAPLNRLTLFSTIIPKGTASALMSMITMMLMAAGNQAAGWVYSSQSELFFGIFCSIMGILHLCAYFLMQL